MNKMEILIKNRKPKNKPKEILNVKATITGIKMYFRVSKADLRRQKKKESINLRIGQ